MKRKSARSRTDNRLTPEAAIGFNSSFGWEHTNRSMRRRVHLEETRSALRFVIGREPMIPAWNLDLSPDVPRSFQAIPDRRLLRATEDRKSWRVIRAPEHVERSSRALTKTKE